MLPSIKYFGGISSKDGISPDPAKVEAIQAIPVITSVKEFHSFLSLVNFCSSLIDKFEWSPACNTTFQEIKEAISTDCLLAQNYLLI